MKMGINRPSLVRVTFALCLAVFQFWQAQPAYSQSVFDDLNLKKNANEGEYDVKKAIRNYFEFRYIHQPKPRPTPEPEPTPAPQPGLDVDAVATENIQDGAITFSKLADDAVFMRTLVVSPVGPNATDNCFELRLTLDAITDSSPSNTYLVYLEPGTYDCGDTPINILPFIGLRGAGELLTTVSSSVPSGDTAAAIVLSNETTLSDLTLINTVGAESTALLLLGGAIAVERAHIDATAINNQSFGIRARFEPNEQIREPLELRLRDLLVTAQSTQSGTGTAIAIPTSGEAELLNVDAIGGAGIVGPGLPQGVGLSFDFELEPHLFNVVGNGGLGLVIGGNATLIAKNSKFDSVQLAAGDEPTARIIYSQVDGVADDQSTNGSLLCFGSYGIRDLSIFEVDERCR